MHIKILLLLAIILVISVLIVFYKFGSHDDVRRSKQQGEEIATLLYKYKAEKGMFPSSLAELKETLPESIVSSDSWKYTVSPKGKYFTLIFSLDENGYPCYVYRSETANWYLDD